MSELVEHGLHLIECEEARLAVNRLREVADIHDYRTDFLALDDLLVHEVVHPCSAPLGAAREVVCEKDANKASVCICHLETLYVRMIYRNAVELLEVKAEELVGSIEYSSTHILHLEIWLGLLLVE